MLPSTNRPTALPKGCLPRAWICALLVAALLVAIPDLAFARDGDIDPTFSDCVTSTGFWGTSQARAVLVQSDGGIVAAGSDGENSRFALARCDSSGTPDNDFGNGGKVITDFGNRPALALALVEQDDGKIVAAGNAGGRFALTRYNPDGTLDSGFGVDGKVLTLVGMDGSASALVLQDDGKIVAGGWASANSTGYGFAIVRYKSDGQLDSTFGTDGIVMTYFNRYNVVWDLVLQPDGKLVAAGYEGAEHSYDIALARYNPDGSLDTSFDTDGKVTTNIGRIDLVV